MNLSRKAIALLKQDDYVCINCDISIYRCKMLKIQIAIT